MYNSANFSTSHPIQKHVSYHKLNRKHKNLIKQISVNSEPKNFIEASKHKCWIEAMKREMEALILNETWEIVQLPPGRKPIGSKWIYKVKYKQNGDIERYKARLVAQGYSQIEGFDYFDTYASVAKITTFKILITLASIKGWHLHQLDVNNAFLHGELNEEIFLKQPPGYLEKNDNRVCRLRKSLYGLKQASRQWFAKLKTSLLGLGFNQSKADYSLFILDQNKNLTFLVVYVDDIVITGTNEDAIEILKNKLKVLFRIKDLGELHYFLEIEVSHSSQGIYLSQKKYALDILSENGLLGSKPSKIPIQKNIDWREDKSPLLEDPLVYRRLIRKLIYLNITRPDITFGVKTLSQFIDRPR